MPLAEATAHHEGMSEQTPWESLSPAAFQRRVADEMDIFRLPTQPYLGLTLAEAERRAAGEGRELVVTDLSQGRPSLCRRRLKVALGSDGHVVGVLAG